MELLIRDAIPGDAEAIVQILNPIIEEGRYSVLDTPFSVEQERRFIAEFPRRGVFLVAIDCEAGEMAGFQNAEPFAGYTGAFDHVACMGTFVAPAYQRLGVARRLFEESFRRARRNGFEKIFTFVRADNPGALAAYCSQGFTVVGVARRQAKIRGEYVDEVLVEKFL